MKTTRHPIKRHHYLAALLTSALACARPQEPVSQGASPGGPNEDSAVQVSEKAMAAPPQEAGDDASPIKKEKAERPAPLTAPVEPEAEEATVHAGAESPPPLELADVPRAERALAEALSPTSLSCQGAAPLKDAICQLKERICTDVSKQPTPSALRDCKKAEESCRRAQQRIAESCPSPQRFGEDDGK